MEGTNNMTAYRVHILIVVFQNNMIDLDKIKLINDLNKLNFKLGSLKAA